MRLLEGKPQPQHARLVFPTVDQGTACRVVQGKLPQYRQPAGVLFRGLVGLLARVGVPARRVDHRGVYAPFIHLLQQVIHQIGVDLPVIWIGGQANPPDVDLGVYYKHSALRDRLSFFSGGLTQFDPFDPFDPFARRCAGMSGVIRSPANGPHCSPLWRIFHPR